MKISYLKPKRDQLQQGNYGETVSFFCIVAGVYALLMSLSVSFGSEGGNGRSVSLSVDIRVPHNAARPALMWLSASGCSCCQERRDSSVHWPECCSALPVVSCVWTSQVKPAPATRRSGECSSTMS